MARLATPSTLPGGWFEESGNVIGDNFDNNDARSLAELDCDYNGLVDSIDNELCAVEGLEGLQAQARKGRTTGARF